MARFINTFAGQNWLITPAALALHEAPPRDIHAQKWLLTLSGVAMVDLKGNIFLGDDLTKLDQERVDNFIRPLLV